jgi:hypothetical protein
MQNTRRTKTFPVTFCQECARGMSTVTVRTSMTPLELHKESALAIHPLILNNAKRGILKNNDVASHDTLVRIGELGHSRTLHKIGAPISRCVHPALAVIKNCIAPESGPGFLIVPKRQSLHAIRLLP